MTGRRMRDEIRLLNTIAARDCERCRSGVDFALGHLIPVAAIRYGSARVVITIHGICIFRHQDSCEKAATG